MSNGDDTFFWDSENTSERHVAGFFSKKNLERLLHLKQNRSIKRKTKAIRAGAGKSFSKLNAKSI